MLETASIAGGATIAVLLVVILCVVVYLHYNRRTKATRTGTDCVDSSSNNRNNFTNHHQPTFGTRWRTNPPPAQGAILSQPAATTTTELPILMQDRGDSMIKQQERLHQESKVELHQVTTLLAPTNEPWSFRAKDKRQTKTQWVWVWEVWEWVCLTDCVWMVYNIPISRKSNKSNHLKYN